MTSNANLPEDPPAGKPTGLGYDRNPLEWVEAQRHPAEHDAAGFLEAMASRKVYDLGACEALAVGLSGKAAKPYPFQPVRASHTHMSGALFQWNTVEVARTYFQRSNDRWTGTLWIVLDDVGEKAAFPPVLPTAIIQTKPGSYQFIYAFTDIVRDAALIETICASAIKGGLTDPSAGGRARITRLPGSLPSDKAHRARLVWMDPTRRFNPDVLIEKGFQVARVEPTKAEAVGEVRLSATTSPEGRTALERACERIRGAQDGERASTINAQAYFIGQHVGAGLIEKGEAESALMAAASVHDRGEGHARNGFRAGVNNPPGDPDSLARLPKPAELESGRLEYLKTAVATGDMAKRVAVAHRLANRVPHRMSVDQVMDFVGEHERLRERVEWIVKARKEAAMERVTLPNDKHLHDFEQVAELTPITTKGVTIVRAPMGSGKTQIIGRALKPDWAICHRVTLVEELARRLDLPHYHSIGDRGGRLAVCLPSIERFDDRPKVIFVDEIAQCLKFLQSNLCGESVYKRFAELIRDAETVVVADAHCDPLTLEFLRQCRPEGEKFRIIEMAAKANGKTVDVYSGPDPVVEEIATELAIGGKVWLASEGARRAEGLAAEFKAQGFRVLCITARTKLDEAVQDRLADLDAACADFDLVIASPAISSGISIQRADFTLGAFLGGGTAIGPDDAVQQLGRVRGLKRFLIGLDANNLTGGLTGQQIREAVTGAASLSDQDGQWHGYDSFRSRVKADRANAQAEFGATLWWMLEAEGWALTLKDETGGENTAKSTKAAKRAHWAAVVAAGGPEDIDGLRAMGQRITATQALQIEAWRVNEEMGELTTEAVEAWDDGRGVGVRERFEDLMAATGGTATEIGPERFSRLTHRKFRDVRRQLLADMFEGVDLTQPIPGQQLDAMMDRVMLRPALYAATGILPRKFMVSWGGKKVTRPKSALREFSAMFRRFGLDAGTVLKTTHFTRSQYTKETQSGSLESAPTGRSDGRSKHLTVGGFEVMERRVERRHAPADNVIQLFDPAPDPEPVKWQRPAPVTITVEVADETIERERGPGLPEGYVAGVYAACDGSGDEFELTRDGEWLQVWDARSGSSAPMMWAAE